MITLREKLPAEFGFKTGARGAHTSRTMMLRELTQILTAVPESASTAAYRSAIVEENTLGKKTESTRRLTFQRLSELYALDPSITLFRVLRKLWGWDPTGRPLLALLCAAARDPLLATTAEHVIRARIGEPVTATDLDHVLEGTTAGRLNASSRHKVARNAASSWTQAGYLKGHLRKTRTKPVVSPGAVTYALLQGYLMGLRGKALLNSLWTRLLDSPTDEVIRFAMAASRRGWMDFGAAGDVVEIRFPALLTAAEEEKSHDST